MKICATCNQLLPVSEFQKDSQKTDGLRSYCRNCRRIRSRQYVDGWAIQRQTTNPPEQKRCSICDTVKPISEFVRDCCRPDGFHVWCKPCRREKDTKYRAVHKERYPGRDQARHRRKWMISKYNMSPDEFLRLLSQQNGLCAICKKKPPSKDGPNAWNVDHDHSTGHVRGVLCGNCNRGIGLFKDNPYTCKSAAEYLSKR